MKPTQLALTAAAALVAGALVRWLLADDDEKDDEAAHRKQAALRARAREIKAQKAMARRPKRARPTAAKRLQQNNALAVAYGGSQEAVDVAVVAEQEGGAVGVHVAVAEAVMTLMEEALFLFPN